MTRYFIRVSWSSLSKAADASLGDRTSWSRSVARFLQISLTSSLIWFQSGILVLLVLVLMRELAAEIAVVDTGVDLAAIFHHTLYMHSKCTHCKHGLSFISDKGILLKIPSCV